MDTDEFIEYLKQEIILKHGGSQKKMAQWLGVSEMYLSEVLRGLKEPGEKITKPLKLKRVITYHW
jgi:plasmid maintenance system antidote protein VapI